MTKIDMMFVGRDRDLQCAINGTIINLSDWNIHRAYEILHLAQCKTDIDDGAYGGIEMNIIRFRELY